MDTEIVTATLRPDQIALYHRNPRRGDVSALEASLRANGQYRPVVINRGTYTGRPLEALAGNHTVIAIRNLGLRFPDDERWEQVAVHYVDVDDDRANRIVLADNKTALMGGFDDVALADLLESVAAEGGLTGTAYSDDELSALLDSVRESEEAEEFGGKEWESGSPNAIQVYVRHFAEIAHRFDGSADSNENVHGHRIEIIWTFELPRSADTATAFTAVKSALTEWVDRAVDHGYVCEESDPVGAYLMDLGCKVLRIDAVPTLPNLAHLFGSVATELTPQASLISTEVVASGGYPPAVWRPSE